MGRRNKKWCQTDVLAAIRVAVPRFIHDCGATRNNAVYVPGSLVDEYCMAVNGTKTNLIPTCQYKICRNLKYHVFDDVLNNNSSVRTTKIDSNNNTTTEEVHDADSNNNNNTGIVLVPKQEDGIDEECPERCRVASIQFEAERNAAATTRATTRATRATTRATAFGHEYERTKIPKGVDTVYRIVQKLTGNLGGGGNGGAIYGEVTKSSMHKLVQLMVDSTNLGPNSRFLDVGSGIGKLNLHVALYPGVKVSIGIELIYERWLLSISRS